MHEEETLEESQLSNKKNPAYYQKVAVTRVGWEPERIKQRENGVKDQERKPLDEKGRQQQVNKADREQ